MKRLALLSGACVLLGAAYAMWLERRRRLQGEQASLELQLWEGEGGNPDREVEPSATGAAYSSPPSAR